MLLMVSIQYIFLLGFITSDVVCQAHHGAVESIHGPGHVNSPVLLKSPTPPTIRKEPFQRGRDAALLVQAGPTSAQSQLPWWSLAAAAAAAAMQHAGAGAGAEAGAAQPEQKGGFVPSYRIALAPQWRLRLQQQGISKLSGYSTAAIPISSTRMLHQLSPAAILAEAADTTQCKRVAADDETYVMKCPGGVTVGTKAITESSTPAAAASNSSAAAGHSQKPQGCMVGTTCAVVLPAVLSVVAALVAAAGGIWAACIRKKRKQAVATP